MVAKNMRERVTDSPLKRRNKHKMREKMLREEMILSNWCQMVTGRLGMAMTKARYAAREMR